MANVNSSPTTNTNNSSSTISEDGALSNATLITNIATFSTWSTNHSPEGGYDYELVEGTDTRYECPICLLCLRDPVLTTCGHRFCSSCISQWVIKENGKCPVDSVPLSAENFFPDNYTRREIMACLVKCPYSTKDNLGCKSVLPIAEMEKHIRTEHTVNNTMMLTLNGGSGPSTSSSHLNGLSECVYRDVGCAIPVRNDLPKHLETNVAYHLQLLTAAYKRLKIYSSRNNLDGYPPELLRQDSRDSTRWLLDESPDDYQFRRQRSWDSVRFARKHGLRPHTSHLSSQPSSSYLQESDESLCHHQHHNHHQPQTSHSLQLQPHHHHHHHPQNHHLRKDDHPEKEKMNNGSGGGGGVEANHHLQDIFQRLVLLEQKDREKDIKIAKLEKELASVVNLFSTSAQIIADFTARYCHGVYVWKIPNFHKLATDMRRNYNRILNSPGFYTDTFGYKLCLRLNLCSPTTSTGASGGVPIDVPLEQDENTFLSLFVHFMQGEFDDTLPWPFNGELKLTVIHPTTPEDSILEIMYSSPEKAAFAKPHLLRNPKGFGYEEFCPINKIFSGGFVKDDMLVCKIVAKPANS